MAQELLPMVTGNSWSLVNPYVASPYRISVTDVHTYGPLKVGTVQFEAPWGPFTLLLSSRADGIYIEGYIAEGVTYHIADGVPLFRTGVPVGTAWQSSFGPITLTQANATVPTNAGSFSGAMVYTVWAGTAAQYSWVLAPGTGFLRFGDGISAFPLTNWTSKVSPAAPASTGTAACPIVGLTSIPTAAGVTSVMRKYAFDEAVSAGSRFLDVNATWAELEPSAGKYSLTRIADEIKLAQQAGVPVMFTLKVTDSIASGLPLDLQAAGLDATATLSRLDGLLTALKPVLTSQVKWVNVGYEVDLYLFYRQNEVAGFRTLFQRAASKLKGIGSYSIGLTHSFDTFRTSDFIFRKLSDLGTHVTFNYYNIGPGFVQRDPAAPFVDVPKMVEAAGGRPLIIGELGYSTGGVNGTAERQATFLANAFDALARQGGRVAAASVWALRDVPSDEVASIAAGQALADNSNFLRFLGSLGLQTSTGSQKPAWSVFTVKSGRFAPGATCAVN